MTYFYRGWNTKKLDAIIEATLKKLDENDNHITLKNGDDIEVYVEDGNWLIIDSPEYGAQEQEISDKYEAVLAIIRMSRRGL